MIVDQIDIGGVALLESENDPPIRPHRNRPETFQVAFERMQAEARKIHVIGRFCPVQDEKDVFDFLRQIGADALALAILEQPFQPLVPETPDHGRSVTCNVSGVNARRRRSRRLSTRLTRYVQSTLTARSARGRRFNFRANVGCSEPARSDRQSNRKGTHAVSDACFRLCGDSVHLLCRDVRLVTAGRAQFGVHHGDGGKERLNRRIRAHGNFAEYVPLILLLVALLEAGGAGRATVHMLLLPLVAARIMHPIGMLAPEASLRQFAFRGASMVVTWLILASAAVLLLLRVA